MAWALVELYSGVSCLAEVLLGGKRQVICINMHGHYGSGGEDPQGRLAEEKG